MPAVVVVAVLWKWRLGPGSAVFAICRMLIQLLLIGFVLKSLFDSEGSLLVVTALTIMLFAASWIALGNLAGSFKTLFPKSLVAIGVSGLTILLVITQGVLGLDPWYEAEKLIPLAGMIFATAMNSVSLAGERVEVELARSEDYESARAKALRAALIPITNSLLAVGLVSLPGMMTGQILADVSPFIAARYQIMVMCMIFGAAGISAALFLVIARVDLQENCKAKSA